MPTSTLDQRTLAADPGWSAIDQGILAGLITANFDNVAPILTASNVTVGAGAGSGASATVTAGANAYRGQLSITTAGTPAAGVFATVVFPVALTGTVRSGTTTPQLYIFVSLASYTASSVNPDLCAVFTTSSATVTGFVLNALAAATTGVTYLVNYQCMG